MTTATPTRPPSGAPAPDTPPPPGGELTSAQWSMTVTPVVAAVTVLCASLALSGVIEGLRWWGYAGVAVTVVTAVGLGLRAARTPILLVGLAQMFALLCLLVALFTDEGVLGVLPGPDALAQLGTVLQTSVEVVRTGVPPVPATQALLCLVVIAIGLVAVLVDTLAVSAGTPAASGLVLLCVYAVPASLADEMLPWWAFVLGALSFAALLAVDGAHRHQLWRNRPTVQGTNGGLGGPAALVAGAVAVALFAGATITWIGTVGQLPGGDNGGGEGGLGLNPFTSLRGMLDQEGNVELFRITGMDVEGGAPYLRAMTLPVYDRNGGWRRDNERELPRGVEAAGRLPLPDGANPPDPDDISEIQVEPVNSRDYWAPVAGIPVGLSGLPDDMRYDAESGMVYGESRRELPTYIEEAVLTPPTPADLAGDGLFTASGEIPSIYLRADGLPQPVVELAQRLTAGKSSTYEKVKAVKGYFATTNGFQYDTETATGADESALEDFLFRSKRGYCEQYASAMAILLRAAQIPSRVAMGYTGGYANGNYRTITTQNAHAWVEVYFPSSGWVIFDPTPLSDGTTYNPPYISDTGVSGPEDDPENPSQTSAAPTASSAPTGTPEDEETTEAGAGGGNQQEQSPALWIWVAIAVVLLSAVVLTALVAAARGRPRRRGMLLPLAVVAWALALVFVAALVSWWLALLVVVLLIAAAPGLVRERRRLAHRHDVHTNSPAAATSAWQELIAESRDRGIEVSSTETVRTAARRMAREHSLDDTGRRALRTVVGEVERNWYGGQPQPDPSLAPAYDNLMEGIRRNSPLNWRAKLLPRSVLRR
ncbi:transglutaminase family protein [Actinophytocola sp. KF-1]